MRYAGFLSLLAVVLLAVSPCAAAGEPSPRGKLPSYKIPVDETRKGDAYVGAQSITIDGTQLGDLLAFSNAMNVSGTITGDVFWVGQSAFIDGSVGDSARMLGQSVTVNGTVDGDLLVFAGSLMLGPKARVTGDVLFFGQQIDLEGEVDGNVKGAGGEATLGGRIGKDVTLKCEAVHLLPEARIEGDLTYQARKQLELEGTGQVKGRVQYEEKKDEKNRESAFSVRRVLWWLYWTVAALVVGLLGLALFPHMAPEIAASVGKDFLGSLGVGFIATIVVPVAAVVICLAVVTIPLSFLLLLLYVIALYLAKLPVAIWLGQRILGRAGRAVPSPFACLALGVPLLYLAFKIPYLGTLLWCGTLFLGLGALILGTRNFLRGRRVAS